MADHPKPQPAWVVQTVRAAQAALRCGYTPQQVEALAAVLVDNTPVSQMLAALRTVPTCPIGCWHDRCQKVRAAIEAAEKS